VLRGAFVGSPSHLTDFDRFNNELLLSTYHLGAENVGRIVGEIATSGATSLQAYPSALSALCDALREAGISDGCRCR